MVLCNYVLYAVLYCVCMFLDCNASRMEAKRSHQKLSSGLEPSLTILNHLNHLELLVMSRVLIHPKPL
jgi:hypothetical protein